MGKLTALYEIYLDKDLLYVGVTNHVPQRLSNHRANPKMGHRIEMRVIEWFDCKEFARRVEAERIRTLQPKLNNLHTSKTTPARSRTVTTITLSPASKQALDSWIEKQSPRPSRSATIEAAVMAYIGRRGR